MNTFNRSLLPIFGILAITLIAGCEESGVVGSSFNPTEPNISVETIAVGQITTVPLISFSGSKANISVGAFDDPLFGTFQAIGLLRPILITRIDSISPTTPFSMKLAITGTYGDTTSAKVVEYSVYEIVERWRPNEWKADSQPVLSASPIASFNISDEDTVTFSLPQEWVERYLSVYYLSPDERDTTYSQSIFGFAIVPQNSGKISQINLGASSMNIAITDTTSRTASIGSRATSYTRTGVTNIPASSIEIMNDFSKTGNIRVQLDESIVGSKIITRAELVLYEDTDALDATLGFGEWRHNNNLIRLYQLTDDDKEFYITKDPFTSAIRNDIDGSYRINLTNTVSNIIVRGGDELSVYIVSDSDNGIIRPNLFVNDPNSPRAPKIIVTRINID